MKRRIFSIIILCVFLFVMLASAYCIALESDHECAGEDCPVCFRLAVCEGLLKSSGTWAAFSVFILIVGLFAVCLPVVSTKPAFIPSLITLKVKLSD